MVHVGRLHDDPGTRLGILLQPLSEGLEPRGIVAQVAFGAVLAVGLQGGNVELPLGDIDTDDDGHAVLLTDVKVIITALDPTLLMRALAQYRLKIPFGFTE